MPGCRLFVSVIMLQQLLDIYHSNMKLSVKCWLCWQPSQPSAAALLHSGVVCGRQLALAAAMLSQLAQSSHFPCWLTVSLDPSHRQAATTLDWALLSESWRTPAH